MKSYINDYLKQEILDSLCEFIKIPNLSPQFINQDSYQDNACQHLYQWIKTQNIPNLKIDIIKQKQAAPLLFIEIPSNSNKTILFYGHYDKQPYGEGWLKSPTHPYIENNKLFGRGGADDGYAIYSSIAIVKTCFQFTNNHPYCYMLFEGEEESGSTNFISYFDSLNLKPIDYIVTLDTGCDEDYDRLWITTSTRGSMTVDVFAQDFQDLRIQLDKIEDSKTGKTMDGLYVSIPEQKQQEIENVCLDINYKFPYKCDKITEDKRELYLNRTWRPTISYIGMSWHKDLIQLRLNIRLPPTKDAKQAFSEIEERLNCKLITAKSGLNIDLKAQSIYILSQASEEYFEKKAKIFHEGGSIPFLNMLQQRLPNTEFIIVGVLGPQSNAHGPNENLDLYYMKGLIYCLSQFCIKLL